MKHAFRTAMTRGKPFTRKIEHDPARATLSAAQNVAKRPADQAKWIVCEMNQVCISPCPIVWPASVAPILIHLIRVTFQVY
jgi:hypothetical protein